MLLFKSEPFAIIQV